MKVTKSAIHRLEVEVKCGCKAAGEYDDAACKKQKGEIKFIACDKHKDAPGLEMLSETLVEVVAKEARETVIPETIHPRTLATMASADAPPAAEGTATAEAAGPARTLRTTGSTGATRTPAAPAPRSAPGSHRPAGAPGGSGASPFRRAQPTSRLSPHAAAAVAGSKVASAGTNPGGIQFGGDLDMDTVPEDTRVTRLIADVNLLGDEDDDGEDLDLD